jgi:hypothetical protein
MPLDARVDLERRVVDRNEESMLITDVAYFTKNDARLI